MSKKSSHSWTVNDGTNEAKEGKSALLICAVRLREMMKLYPVMNQSAIKRGSFTLHRPSCQGSTTYGSRAVLD